MVGCLEVFGRVFVLGGIAAPDVSSRQAQPQVDPPVTQFDAFWANVLVGSPNLDLIHMLALHVFLLLGGPLPAGVTSLPRRVNSGHSVFTTEVIRRVRQVENAGHRQGELHGAAKANTRLEMARCDDH